MPKIKDLTGQVFTRLTVLGLSPWSKPPVRYVCRCSCGAITTVVGRNLVRGFTKSCGCLLAEHHTGEWAIGNQHARRHGMARTPEYKAWDSMRDRCSETPSTPKNKAHYFDRGIRVCEAWQHDFMAFYKHIGPRPGPGFSVDRIDNDRGYEPGNVRWATHSQQMENRRPFSLPQHFKKRAQ